MSPQVSRQRLLSFPLLLLAGLFPSCGADAPPDDRKPNIILILCDDLGIGDVGAYNPEGKIPTPNIDRLGREGMRFTDAHTNSSVCSPTRYGILTGRYAWRTRLKKGVLDGYSPPLIEPGRMTVASLLKAQGYHTAFIGKWHLGWDWHRSGAKPEEVDFAQPIRNGPGTCGFDYAFGHAASLDMPPYVWVDNGRPTAVPEQETERTATESKNGWWRRGPTAPDFDHGKVMEEFTRRAVDYIGERATSGKPFFLYLPYASPHTPVLPTADYAGKSGLQSAYADFVVMNDAHIGRVMAAVEAAGIAGNTLIVFTSDNGCSPQADFEELARQGHRPGMHYRGAKADIFEGGHRVPFIARWPGKITPGSLQGETICVTDLLATCADIVGARLPEDAGEDSVSLLPALRGSKEEPRREATVHHSVDGTFAIRQGRWKLIDAPHSGGWSDPRPRDRERLKELPPVQLYDLEADPGETTNLQDRHPEVVLQLKSLLAQYQNAGRSTPWPRP